MTFNLAQYGITGETTNHSIVGYHVHRNPPVAKLYSLARCCGWRRGMALTD